MDFYYFLDESDEEINESPGEKVKVPKRNLLNGYFVYFFKKIKDHCNYHLKNT